MSETSDRKAQIRSRLFTVLTARLEQATQLAARGQNPRSTASNDIAHELIDIGQETVAIAEAALLIDELSSQPRGA